MNSREIRNTINNIFYRRVIHPVNVVSEVACDLGAVVVDAVNEADVFVWDAVQNHVSAVIMKEMGRW